MIWEHYALIGTSLTAVSLVFVIDRMRAKVSNYKYVMGKYVDNATANRTHRLGADTNAIVKLFGLKNRTLTNPKDFVGKPRHPAFTPPGSNATRKRKRVKQ